jgi:polysaccharide pyruvyl transferase WcaK-like protein
MFRILIPEETPSLNKGEAAIFAGIIESLQGFRNDIQIAMYSFDPETDAERYSGKAHILNASGIMPKGIMFKELGRFRQAIEYALFLSKHICFLCLHLVLRKHAIKVMRRDIWAYYIEADAIIMAHDSAFAPLYHSFLILFLKLLRKPVIIYGASFPANNGQTSIAKALFYRLIIKRALAAVDLITLRERDSYEYLQSLRVGNHFHLTGDFAFLVKPAGPERVSDILKKENLIDKTPIIGMTVSRNMIRHAYPNLKDYAAKEEKCVSELAKVIDYINDKLETKVVFIPHSILKDKDRDDRIIARKIMKAVRNQDMVKTIENEYSPEELKGLTSIFEMCIGTRLHFIIDAVSTFVPSIIISGKDDFRIHGIIGKGMGLMDSIYYIEEFDHRTLIGKIELYWKDRQEMRQSLITKMEKVQRETMANGVFFKELFS